MDFQLRYDRWYRPLATVLGTGPKRTSIRVADGTLSVKHGWAFRTEIPLASIRSVESLSAKPLAWGVHASADGWLVNGSRHGIVDIRFDPPITPSRTPLSTGRIGSLQLSLADPDRFIAACTRR